MTSGRPAQHLSDSDDLLRFFFHLLTVDRVVFFMMFVLGHKTSWIVWLLEFIQGEV